MFQEPISLVDGSIYAYLLVDFHSLEILDGNLMARTYYKSTCNYPSLESIFAPLASEETVRMLSKTLKEEGSITLDRVFSTKITEETFPCHIEICKVSEDMLFFVIKEKNKHHDTPLEELVEIADNPIFVLNNDENFTLSYGNRRYHHCVQVNKSENAENSSSFLNLLSPDKRDYFRELANEELEKFGECDLDIEITFDGEYYQLFHFSAYQSLVDKQIYGVLISAKKQRDLMRKIEYDQQYFDIMQKFSKDLLFRIDVKKSTLVHRGDISKLVGLEPEMEHFPECIRDTGLVHPDDYDKYISFVHKMLGGSEASCEPRFQFKNGTFEKYRLQGSPLFDVDGNTVQVVGKCENIQKFVDIEAKANYDSLTSALNKQSFRELVEDLLKRAVDRDNFALLFLDLDNFKSVNDTLGHIFGDFLLEAAGKRIMNCIRKQDRLGRVGGDEFVVFFQFAPSHEAVLERAEAILHSLRREFNYESQVCRTCASIGIALFPEHGDNYEELYLKADKALYASKAKGKDVATIYKDGM